MAESSLINTKTALLATAGIGLICVVMRHQSRILAHLRNFRNPLAHKSIQIVETADECQRVVNILKQHCHKYRMLGFDCVWVTVGGTRRPVALLQLSSQQGLCALFRLCYLQQIPKSLRELLEDDEVIKVGVAPQDDAHKLAYDYGVGVASTFDLRFLAALTNQKPEGLTEMSKALLNVQLDKNWRLACSDWEAKVLSEKQLEYAANDALVAVRIFEHLMKQLEARHFWQLKPPNFETVYTQLEPFFDMRFKEGSFQQTRAQRKLGAVGEVGRYYQTPKENQCVVCGRRDAYIRKNVVPREYRKHFPVVMKSHTSHDVLLCPDCHQLSNIFDLRVRSKLAELCDAPFAHEEGAVKYFEVPELSYEARCEHLRQVVLDHYGEKELTDELLQEAGASRDNENYWQHGEKVVQKYQTEFGGLLELEKLWREHFLNQMKPKFLPALWNVNHNANW